MIIDLTKTVNKNETIAVAVSGGSDSMALLHYMHCNAEKFRYSLIAINVEHGIRGNTSILDTEFVKEYCAKNNIPLLTYSVDCKKESMARKLSIEETARLLRYQCFFDAISSGKCDKIATAHHVSDNVESVLLNLFRGTGLRGLTGINTNYSDKIIRPFLNTTKQEILDYIKNNDIPFVTDESNLSTDYTRNFLRLEVLPKIKQVFPELEKSVSRFCLIAKEEDEYLDEQSRKQLTLLTDRAEILLPCHPALLKRASITALKHLGIVKDWEKAHVDSIQNLTELSNGAKINLPKNIVAIKEYNKIVIYKETKSQDIEIPFSIGEFSFLDKTIVIKKASSDVDLKSGFFIDKASIKENAVIRTKRDGDNFTKFGGGTKKLNDYLTDKKVPLRVRDTIPVLANNNEIYAIFNIAVSENSKVISSTTDILQLIIK